MTTSTSISAAKLRGHRTCTIILAETVGKVPFQRFLGSLRSTLRTMVFL